MHRHVIGYATSAAALGAFSLHASLTALALLAWLLGWQIIDVTPLSRLQSAAAVLLVAGCLLVAAFERGRSRGLALTAAVLAPAVAIPVPLGSFAPLGASGWTLAVGITVQTATAAVLVGLSLGAVALLLRTRSPLDGASKVAFGVVLAGAAAPHALTGAWAALSNAGWTPPADALDAIGLLAALAVAAGYAALTRATLATAHLAASE